MKRYLLAVLILWLPLFSRADFAPDRVEGKGLRSETLKYSYTLTIHQATPSNWVVYTEPVDAQRASAALIQIASEAYRQVSGVACGPIGSPTEQFEFSIRASLVSSATLAGATQPPMVPVVPTKISSSTADVVSTATQALYDWGLYKIDGPLGWLSVSAKSRAGYVQYSTLQVDILLLERR